MIRAGWYSRRAKTAMRIVARVAKPSSTRNTVSCERKPHALSAVEVLASHQLVLFASDDRVQGCVRDAPRSHDIPIDDLFGKRGRSCGDCAHGELFVTGDAQLAHDEDV